MSRQILRSLAGQLLVYALLVEAHDPAAPDLDNRYACLPGLAHDVPRRVRVAFYVDLLERDFALFEVTLHTLAPPLTDWPSPPCCVRNGLGQVLGSNSTVRLT